MYKRLIVCVMAMCSVMCLSAQEVESAQSAENQQVQGMYPRKLEKNLSDTITHWSVFLHGGFNVFDGDFKSEQKHAVYLPTIGVGAEYNFNSTWGIGAEYIFRGYQARGNTDQNAASTLLKGQMHQADAFLTFDIINVWWPKNRLKPVALNLMLGGGVMWFKNSIMYPNVEYVYTNPDGSQQMKYKYNTAAQPAESNSSFKSYGVFMGGVMLEFNVSRSISLGLRGVYNYFTKDEVDGRVRGNNNDGVFDAELILRYKIDAIRHSQARNMPTDQTYQEILIEQDPSRDPRRKDTVVIYHHHVDTIVMKTIVQATEMQQDDYSYVYFENDVADIDNQGLVVIQQCANKMLRNTDLYAVVVGYCDATGTREHNAALGELRAHNVADELIREYGISEKRVLPIGRGMITTGRRAGSYSPNRRAEIRMMSEKEFNKITGRYKAAKAEDLTGIKNGNGREVVIEERTTLSKLARDYYENANCWVYIFIANQDIMDSPNSLEEGTIITLPDLDEQQKLITREHAAELYKRIK